MAVRANSFESIAVSDLFSAYCELISSSAQITRCQEATSVGELLSVIKNLWRQTALSDDQLIAELTQLNQQIIDSDKIQLAGHWLPYCYHAKTRSIHWCLPAGHAIEPFQDETISRYRQTVLLNQFITPKTSLASLDIHAQVVQSITPAGFIFHLSRCGSTLISGCLSELDTTSVFSESSVLTEILLDQTLGEATQQQHLQQLIDLQASVFPSRPDVVIKWNAWDIFRWELIRAVYPQVPVIFLVRNPVEILASHQRSAGRHMSGDSVLAAYYPELAPPVNDEKIEDFRIRVLAALLIAMAKHCHATNVAIVDYAQLDLNKIYAICNYFAVAQSSAAMLSLARRTQVNAKSLGHSFSGDSEQKRQQFDVTEKTLIESRLLHLYQQLASSALIERK